MTDVCLFREGLTRLLLGRPDVEVTGAIAPDPGVLDYLMPRQPDVVLMDSTTVRTSDIVRHLVDRLPSAKSVAFAVAEADDEEILRCAECGVAGFVGRGASVEELMAVLRGAMRGETTCSAALAAVLFRQVARLAPLRSAAATDHRDLTRREAEIVAFIDGGLSNKEIAQRLGIAVATVKSHIHNILEKLQVRRRTDAAARIRARSRRSALADSGRHSASEA